MEAALRWTPVQSSNLASVAYDAERRRLWIQFKTGVPGYYEDVSETAYYELMAARSKGEYHHRTFVLGGFVWRRAGSR